MTESQIRRIENRLFFLRWLKNPRQLGTLAPISVKLSLLAAKAALEYYKPGTPMVEIGAGTGRLTRALLREGVAVQDLTVVELDPEMCVFLRQSIPGLHVIEGDACSLPQLISPEICGKVGVVVSAIPLMYLDEPLRKILMDAAFSVLRSGSDIIHVTYNPRSPLNFWKDVRQNRVGAAWLNLPPGFVWQFQQA